jgi:preprotein translocase subunit SecE
VATEAGQTVQTMMRKALEFFKDVRVEIGKISWPNRHELQESTIVVIITVVLITIFVGTVDQVFSFLVKTLAKTL